jgi:hypothetical protein
VTEARGRHHGAVRATSPWDGAARARWRERWRCGVGVRCKMDLRLESVRDLFTVQDAEMGIGH